MSRLRPFVRALAWGLLGGALLAAAPSQTPAELIPERPIERELAAGEAHSYSIELAARPWRVAVEQRGIDVVVSVSRPDGRRVAVDSPQDRQGPETVLIEPAAAGTFLVEVRAREPASPSGRYEIRVEEVPANPEAHRLAAERAVTRAGERYLEGTAEARRQALAEHRVALEAWRALGDRRGEARSLYAMAVLSRLVNDTREALKRGTEVLPLWQSLGDRPWEASTWNEIGLDRWLLGESAEGRAAFEKALAIQRETGDRYGEGVSSSNLCLMDLARGELKAGLACYERAIPVLREVKAEALMGSALLNVGRAYDVLGEPEASLERYRQALDRMRAQGDRSGEARTLNNLGLLHLELGDYQEALKQFGQALDIFRALEDRRWQAHVLHNMGLVDHTLGELPRALSSYEQALRLWREVGDPKGEAATLATLGQVRSRLGEHREALRLNQQALALNRAAGDRWREGVTLNQLGRASMALNDFSAALAVFDQAIELLGATGSLADQAEALRNRGEAYTRLGNPAKGMESLRQALDLTRTTGHRAGEAQVEFRLAQAERSLGHPVEARAHAEAALAILETLRTRIASPDLRASFSDLSHNAYDLCVDLLMEAHRAAPGAGYDRKALETTERARARTLLELLAEGGVDVRQGVDPGLLERRTSLLRRLSAKAERALRERPKSQDERAALEEDRYAILRDLEAVEGEIRERSPGYADLIQPRPLSASGIQNLLDGDTLLLSYALGEPRSFLWAVTSKGVASFELPGRALLEEAARRFHQDLSAFDPADRPREAKDAAALASLLLGPVAGRLNHQRLVVVPDGALAYVPFGALPLPGGEPGVPLLARHEVVHLPSASALAVQRRLLARRLPAPKLLAVLADPVFDPRDPRVSGSRAAVPSRAAAERGPLFERLPGSRAEAEAIAALVPPAESLKALDFDASRDLALGDRLSGYRVVHFATHGVLDAQHPALSGLALSMVDRKGAPQEGFLHLHDIYNLRLSADLVVLSGCRTALGKEVSGEGLIGLTRGFLYAGAPRVVASLWKVEDQATAALMARLYQGLWIDRLRPAAALRAAQLSLRGQRRFRDPYFWAGFVLEGDWN
ncbi:MAG TPA: CHAT domain-containing tetratricopeptide repeat protein [Thermoanaerobaculia bacterium]|jgi:CHAT domain-containing protein/Tfp pilus assembly protein PilF|nr:CHAT domain-containing tetratricopeptide repeat protein [Thermoanaerobaculia bacterium]